MRSVVKIVRFACVAGLGISAGCMGAAAFSPTGVAAAPPAAATTSQVPREIDIAGTLRNHFHGVKGYLSGDFLTRGQVEESLTALERKTGWKLEEQERKSLLSLTIDDKSFLAQQLTSKAGKSFARHISPLPLGYDKLDRLSQLPQGRSTIERLVTGPDGHKLLEYMTTSRGGHDLSRMLSADGKGNFEKPTGKIYDELQLMITLKQLHQAAVAREDGARRSQSRGIGGR